MVTIQITESQAKWIVCVFWLLGSPVSDRGAEAEDLVRRVRRAIHESKESN